MTDADILIALGDVTEVAGRLGIPASTVANWKSRGIPWEMRPRVKALARRSRVKLPVNYDSTRMMRKSDGGENG